MNEANTLGYHPGTTFIYRINAAAKLLFFLIVSVACMTTFDTRFLVLVAILSLLIFKWSHLKWRQVAFVVKFIAFFSILNVILVFVFSPQYGVHLYGAKTVIISAGYFTVTTQELFYLLNVTLKYVCTVPLALVFIMTTNPSLFASSLNRLGISYKISYAVALTLRYIPDVQREFGDIKDAQQARGSELSSKGKLTTRLHGIINIIIPLILSSFENIDRISTAMQLRRFGSKKKRTWYTAQPFRGTDALVLGLAILLLMITILLFQVNHGRFYNPFQ
ncbi:energy-coupling factor transporter transmembrane component T family protein [Fructilactobacillus carniphilus]|uniref:Energy-coupling factor transporter transmembrane protein EcfT n=1 Tax=Fructilactobacillus carniphilus TaxID=2940297 RepID=A0ABY5BXY4_9LACO|nr:energy-coupling factor transporter transmembrane component T [Fructilactobacillus carniphilus]USS90228.1 energy-coupling factor transporter transmembrane protein EcfT [Fructilactobacillus carniphilus]